MFGSPKIYIHLCLQTLCSKPYKDGLVIYNLCGNSIQFKTGLVKDVQNCGCGDIITNVEGYYPVLWRMFSMMEKAATSTVEVIQALWRSMSFIFKVLSILNSNDVISPSKALMVSPHSTASLPQ